MNDTEKAKRAAALLNDEVVQDAFAELDEHYTRSWKASTDPVSREHAWQLYNAMQQFKSQLNSLISTGKMEEVKLKQSSLIKKVIG